MLHDNIKKLREEYDITPLRFAKFMKVEEVDILDWESGKKEPTLSQIHEIANLFDIPVTELLSKTTKDKVTQEEKSSNGNIKDKSKSKKKKKTKTKHKTKKINNKTVEKKRNWPLILIFIILLFVAGGGGYLYWKYGDEYSLVKKNQYTIEEMVGTFTNESSYEEQASTLTLQSNGTYVIMYNTCNVDTSNEGTWVIEKEMLTLTDKDSYIYKFKISSTNKIIFTTSELGCSISKNDVFIRGSINGNKEEEDDSNTEIPNTSESDSSTSFIEIGQWSGNYSTLNITNVDGNKVIFTLQSFDPENAANVASLTHIEGNIKDDTITFTFDDDGYGNAGIGTIKFSETQAIFQISKTEINEEATWSILDSGTLMK